MPLVAGAIIHVREGAQEHATNVRLLDVFIGPLRPGPTLGGPFKVLAHTFWGSLFAFVSIFALCSIPFDCENVTASERDRLVCAKHTHARKLCKFCGAAAAASRSHRQLRFKCNVTPGPITQLYIRKFSIPGQTICAPRIKYHIDLNACNICAISMRCVLWFQPAQTQNKTKGRRRDTSEQLYVSPPPVPRFRGG